MSSDDGYGAANVDELVPEPMVVPGALHGERVDRAVALITGWSRGVVQGLIDDDAVLVGGVPAVKSRRLVEGEVVELLAGPLADVAPAAEPIPLDLRHVDDDLIVLNKPAGLVVHPGPGHAGATLVNGLLAQFPEIAVVGGRARPGIVHRLDRDTSGLLMVARTPRTYDALVEALARRSIDRRYLALVRGVPEVTRGVVDAPIGRSAHRRTRMAVTTTGRAARTTYEVRSVWAARKLSLLECRLESGRTHQVRVHLSAIGHAVVGDGTYGGARADVALARPFLHAYHLGLAHPITGTALSFDEALPAELIETLADLGPPDPEGDR